MHKTLAALPREQATVRKIPYFDDLLWLVSTLVALREMDEAALKQHIGKRFRTWRAFLASAAEWPLGHASTRSAHSRRSSMPLRSRAKPRRSHRASTGSQRRSVPEASQARRRKSPMPARHSTVCFRVSPPSMRTSSTGRSMRPPARCSAFPSSSTGRCAASCRRSGRASSWALRNHGRGAQGLARARGPCRACRGHRSHAGRCHRRVPELRPWPAW